MQTILVILLALVAPSSGRFSLEKGPFLKLPDKSDRYVLNSGTATKADYDPQENFLYVVGMCMRVFTAYSLLFRVSVHVPMNISNETVLSILINIVHIIPTCPNSIASRMNSKSKNVKRAKFISCIFELF